MKVCCVFLLESPHGDDSNEHTRDTIINIKKKITQIIPNTIISAAMRFFVVRNSHGIRNISARATEVLL